MDLVYLLAMGPLRLSFCLTNTCLGRSGSQADVTVEIWDEEAEDCFITVFPRSQEWEVI